MAESLMSYELSFSQRVLDGALSYGINLYYIDGDNMIMTVPTDGKPKNVNTGKIETGALKPISVTALPRTGRQMPITVGCTWRIR